MNSAVPASMLAFTYQSRYALRQLLNAIFAGKDAAVAVEALGDVEERADGGVNLHELKMHAEGGFLAERSLDLWKTLRIWSCHAREAQIGLPETTLILATTHEVSKASDFLKALTTENRTAEINERIVNELTVVAEAGGNKANAKGYEEFLGLTLQQRLAVVGQMVVVSASPAFAELDAEIERMAGRVFHGVPSPKRNGSSLSAGGTGRSKACC